MICQKDRDKLEKFNSFCCKMIYVPICLFISAYFVICNLVLLPFAYLKSLFHKYRLYKNTNGLPQYRRKLCIYFFFGVPLLLISQLTDLYYFIKHSYKWNMQKLQVSNAYPKISLRAFNKVFNMVTLIEGEKYNAKKLVLEINEKFKVNQCIFGVLYTNR